MRNSKTKKLITDIIFFTALAAGSFAMMYPLLWMILTSVQPPHEVTRYFIPRVFTLSAWRGDDSVWGFMNLARGYRNTIITTVPVVIVQIFVSAMAAYAFAKLNFKGKNTLFLIMLGSMMIPFAVVMIPQVMVFRELGLIRGPLAVIIPKMFGSVMTVFFLRQFLYGIPTSLSEAAKLDGAGHLRIFLTIMFPLIMPAIAAQAILSFIGNWNDFLGPLLFIPDPNWQPLPVMLNAFSRDEAGGTEFVPRLMAASLVTMIPIFIVFVAFQKKIISSIVFSAVKG